MLHFRSREERDVAATDLDSPDVQNLIASGLWFLREGDGQESAAPPNEAKLESTPPTPSESEPAPAPESRRPKRRPGQLGPRHEDETE